MLAEVFICNEIMHSFDEEFSCLVEKYILILNFKKGHDFFVLILFVLWKGEENNYMGNIQNTHKS